MKTFWLKLSLSGLAILLSLIINAQNPQALSDSLPVFKPKKSVHNYLINHASLKEVSFTYQMPVKYAFPGGRLLSDSVNYTGPTFGIGFLGLRTARARTFLLRGELDCDNPGLNWTIALFSEGLLEKVRSNVAQEDGSYSLETEKTITLYWEKDAGGMIVEKADTMGRFYISVNPAGNEYLQQFTGIVYGESTSPVKAINDNHWYQSTLTTTIPEYGIYGKIRGRNFALLNNGVSFQSYIFIEGELSGIFQSDIDFQPMIKKSERIQPYLLFDNTSDIILQNDIFRLAIMSRFLMEVLGRSTY